MHRSDGTFCAGQRSCPRAQHARMDQMTKTDVTVVGAGPYGLSAAAYLRTIQGLEVRVFGEPMSFWERNMPKGMFLRSNWTATQIASPDGTLSLEAYQE